TTSTWATSWGGSRGPRRTLVKSSATTATTCTPTRSCPTASTSRARTPRCSGRSPRGSLDRCSLGDPRSNLARRARRMNDSFYERAARDLPNFEPEVVRLWFEHVESAGWPPTFDAQGLATGVWRSRVFRERPIAFWRSVSWSLERVALTIMSLEP